MYNQHCKIVKVINSEWIKWHMKDSLAVMSMHLCSLSCFCRRSACVWIHGLDSAGRVRVESRLQHTERFILHRLQQTWAPQTPEDQRSLLQTTGQRQRLPWRKHAAHRGPIPLWLPVRCVRVSVTGEGREKHSSVSEDCAFL